ncbi:MAG: sigma-54 dependent transcriptional regulator [Cytophagales bacterium]|nr:sigma-54 dependent transcriptional regulator [Cytophagales bacterium]MDW8383549.1 sigma-54 dependent transcriptional regulator [Flammeovirgaceae bacterium]
MDIESIKQRFGIIGNSPKLNYAIEVAVQVAPTDLTVLITGESGSGKESFSKIIHQLSHRKHGQFIAINCGAIPEGTIDSELFGHEKGSFTGATEMRKGYFEVTDGGTIFLDEIGEMPLSTQARLLRVLENKEFIRVGSSKVQKTDVRVIAATNVNLLEAVEKKRFREDLYYRLSTVPIYVPPLRERGNDIELLFKKFTTDFAEKYRIKPITLTPEAKELLLRFPFPGNIRQLKNIAEQISLLEINREITAERLQKYLTPTPSPSTSLILSDNARNADLNEREILYKVLFDMKRDVAELKKLVLTLLENGMANANQILQANKHLFQEENIPEIKTPSETSTYPARPLLIEPSKESKLSTEHGEETTVDVEEVTNDYEDESLSLSQKEKEMIIKALKKNRNKRKYAAQDLGISERTLYRKIKQYDIED